MVLGSWLNFTGHGRTRRSLIMCFLSFRKLFEKLCLFIGASWAMLKKNYWKDNIFHGHSARKTTFSAFGGPYHRLWMSDGIESPTTYPMLLSHLESTTHTEAKKLDFKLNFMFLFGSDGHDAFAKHIFNTA